MIVLARGHVIRVWSTPPFPCIWQVTRPQWKLMAGQGFWQTNLFSIRIPLVTVWGWEGRSTHIDTYITDWYHKLCINSQLMWKCSQNSLYDWLACLCISSGQFIYQALVRPYSHVSPAVLLCIYLWCGFRVSMFRDKAEIIANEEEWWRNCISYYVNFIPHPQPEKGSGRGGGGAPIKLWGNCFLNHT